MDKQNLNINVNEDDLNHTFNNILLLEKLFILEIKEIYEIEEGISIINHYIMSITNRAISLNRGFVTLAESNNYQTAISLMRLQLDNCLRLYAISLSNNAGEFYEKVLNGEHIRNLKDRDGNKMTDNYLVSKIDTIFPQFESLYKKLSGHVHFSSEHFSFNNKNENDTYFISVGNVENLNIAEKVDYAFNMFLVSKALLSLITHYKMEIKK